MQKQCKRFLICYYFSFPVNKMAFLVKKVFNKIGQILIT